MINKTYSKKYSDETKFYTSDTALELNFQLKEVEYDFDSAEIILLNVDDGSLVTRPVVKSAVGFTYELEDDIVEHYGEWKGQLKFNEGGEIYVSSPVSFRIDNDLNNDRPPKLTEVNTWKNLREIADKLIIDLQIEQDAALEFLGNRQDKVESEFNVLQQEMTDKDPISAPEIIVARNGEDTLKARLDKDLAQTKQRFEENPNPSIGKGPKDTRPVITIVTDDARRQDITIFKDMFQRVGLPVSTAVSPNRNINTPDYGNVYLTVDEIRTLQDEFGWEIVSHTWNHERLTEISDEALDFTLKESRDWLRDNGFKGYEYLMYPFGLYDERVKRVAAKYYRAARTTAGLWGSVINQFPVASYQLSTRFFSQTVSLDILKADVDRLIERGGWLNLFFHSWEIDDWSREADFEELLNYVKSKQDLGLVDVMGYKDTYERYGNIIDQASYVDKDDDMFIVQQNGNVRTNFGKTKKIANNSLNNSSLPNEFPLDYTSYMTSTISENGFPTPSGTLETIYFNPNPNEPTNTRYCRQTYYPYNSSRVYTRGYLADGWTAWSTPGSGTSTPTESQFAIITGSSVNGNTPPSEFPASKLTLYSKGTNTPGMPTTIGGILSVCKIGTDYSFWYQEFKASGGNRKWRRYATSGTAWSAWQLIVADYGGTRPTNVAPGFMFFDSTIGKPVWLKSEGVWVDATGTTV